MSDGGITPGGVTPNSTASDTKVDTPGAGVMPTTEKAASPEKKKDVPKFTDKEEMGKWRLFPLFRQHDDEACVPPRC